MLIYFFFSCVILLVALGFLTAYRSISDQDEHSQARSKLPRLPLPGRAQKSRLFRKWP